MNLKQELQALSTRLDKCKRKLAAAQKRFDQEIINQAQHEITGITAQMDEMKRTQASEVSDKTAKITRLKFNRPLSKSEQANLGKLKKSVRGLVVVHPLTAIGREIGVKEVTGFAPKEF